jgi:hypothetical protein
MPPVTFFTWVKDRVVSIAERFCRGESVPHHTNQIGHSLHGGRARTFSVDDLFG